MSYDVKIGPPPKGTTLTVPPLLVTVGKYVATLEHGDIGWFDGFALAGIPREWAPDHAKRLREHGYVFLSLPDGSMLALLNAGGTVPSVVLLGSEGERRTVADSLEEFLVLWSKGETGISELDDEEAEEGREAFAAWLKKQKIKVPKTASIDFQAWLDGATTKRPPPKTTVVRRKPTPAFARLGPKVKELAALVGTRADDPATVRYIEKTLKKKPPKLASDRNGAPGIDASKLGIQLGFDHDVNNDAYVPIAVTKSSFVPYTSTVWLDDAIKEQVLGVDWAAKDAAAVARTLGAFTSLEPRFMGEKPSVPTWDIVLDEAAHVDLNIEFDKRVRVRIQIRQARELEKFDRVTTGLFIAWAATRKLLDHDRLAAHADLVAKIAKRQAQGTALWDAFGRGMWDDFLVDKPGLRLFAYSWFKNIGKVWIVKDLIKVFGKRVGEYGHDEPKLDDDSWAAVDKASKTLDERFKSFLKP